jgi:hypothetical protein
VVRSTEPKSLNSEWRPQRTECADSSVSSSVTLVSTTLNPAGYRKQTSIRLQLHGDPAPLIYSYRLAALYRTVDSYCTLEAQVALSSSAEIPIDNWPRLCDVVPVQTTFWGESIKTASQTIADSIMANDALVLANYRRPSGDEPEGVNTTLRVTPYSSGITQPRPVAIVLAYMLANQVERRPLQPPDPSRYMRFKRDWGWEAIF